MPLEIRTSARTHIGLKRRFNEDAYRVFGNGGVLAIADGMGGHAAGAIASGIVMDCTEARAAELLACSTNAAERIIWEITYAAQKSLRNHTQTHPDTFGMGTTWIVAQLSVLESQVTIGHVGDSRAYLLRAEQLVPLTDDHSTVFERYVNTGTHSREDVRLHPDANSLTRALCAEYDTDCSPTVNYLGVLPGDRLLLCTDGLTDMVAESDLVAPLRDHPREEAADQLVQMALDAGGRDNITLIVADVASQSTDP